MPVISYTVLWSLFHKNKNVMEKILAFMISKPANLRGPPRYNESKVKKR